MYDTVKLEKGMYHLANRSFTQALEAADPSAQYAGTELAELDAFERQLKRFDIHVSGADCDPVEKFFTTTESAVLFPEFVRRAIMRGMEESILPELTAASSKVNATSCKG
ncbi:MAG: phage major capsid protein, partial [Oscillospiraceae bacterium]|nr:phage major capsid protein [Oscillospiraceae bacterium]